MILDPQWFIAQSALFFNCESIIKVLNKANAPKPVVISNFIWDWDLNNGQDFLAHQIH